MKFDHSYIAENDTELIFYNLIFLLQEIIANLAQEGELKSKFFIHNHFKEKQKERRGSDSDLVRNNKKHSDDCDIIFDEKKRRLSQTEQVEHDHHHPSIVGSTNVGTIAGLPQKPRKDKIKIRDVFKKESNKIKMFSKMVGDKLQSSKLVSLPVAGDINMEAKFKQGLLEGNTEKRSSHRTDVNNVMTDTTDKVYMYIICIIISLNTKLLYIYRVLS